MGFAFDGGAYAASDPSCISERTHSYRLNGGLVEGLDQGGLTFTLAEARMNPPVIKAIGSGCALNELLLRRSVRPNALSVPSAARRDA